MPRKTLSRDIEMLMSLGVKEKGLVAQHYKMTLRGLDSWLHRIRERRREFQWYLNNMLNIEKRNARMKKILLSAKIPDHLLAAEESSGWQEKEEEFMKMEERREQETEES